MTGCGVGEGSCLENTVTPKNKIHLCINWLKACREVENTCHWSRKILLYGFTVQERAERPYGPSNNNIMFLIKKNIYIQSPGRRMNQSELKQQQQQQQNKTKVKTRVILQTPFLLANKTKTEYYDFSQLAPKRSNLCKMAFLCASEKKKKKITYQVSAFLIQTSYNYFKYNIHFC